MQAMGAIPKHWTANLLQIYKRNTNFQISTKPAPIACMLLAVGATLWFTMALHNSLIVANKRSTDKKLKMSRNSPCNALKVKV
jgi:hypothetical protein